MKVRNMNPNCRYFEQCGMPSNNPHDINYCLLHSNKIEKNLNDFESALLLYQSTYGFDFRFMVFPEKFSFERTVFHQNVNFRNCIFLGDSNFRFCTFENEIFFDDSIFYGKSDFESAKFLSKASFAHCRFNNSVYFFETLFSKSLDFRNSYFEKDATFSSGNGNIQFKNVLVDFREVSIVGSDILIFKNTDFERVLFSGINFNKTEFIGVLWPKKGYRNVLFEELLAREKIANKTDDVSDNLNLYEVEKLYRDLKKTHEVKGDYSKAGDFHYGEKEMQRLNPSTRWGLRWLLLFPYWLVSGYGEAFLRPIMWALCILLLGTVSYFFSAVGYKNNLPLNIYNWQDWVGSLLFSLETMLLIKSSYLIPHGNGYFIKTIQTLAGPLFLGLFGLAIRQRLKR